MSVTIETGPSVRGIGHAGNLIDGLVAYWDCNEGSGTILNDIHGHNDGTLVNASFSPNGVIGSCIESDYFGDYVRITNTSIFDNIYDQLTISFWVRFNTLPMGTDSYNVMVYIADGLNNAVAGIFISELDNRIYYTNRISGSTNHQADYVYSSVISNTTSFMHVVCITQGIGQNFKIYINGADDTMRSWGATGPILPIFGSHHFLLNNGGVRAINGYMDEIGLWTRALSLTEVQRLWNYGNGLPYPFN